MRFNSLNYVCKLRQIMLQISVVLFHPAQVLPISILTDESLIFELIYNIHLLNLSEHFQGFILVFYSLISFNMSD